jgi:hypothetical protein
LLIDFEFAEGPYAVLLVVVLVVLDVAVVELEDVVIAQGDGLVGPIGARIDNYFLFLYVVYFLFEPIL